MLRPVDSLLLLLPPTYDCNKKHCPTANTITLDLEGHPFINEFIKCESPG